MKKLHSDNAESDDDCLRQQAEKHDTSYVISCNFPDDNICIRLSSNQSLPIEDNTGIICLVYNNTHDTLITSFKETPLISLLKPAFTLQGIKFISDHSRFHIIDAWASDYLNVTKPSNKQKSGKSKVT